MKEYGSESGLLQLLIRFSTLPESVSLVDRILYNTLLLIRTFYPRLLTSLQSNLPQLCPFYPIIICSIQCYDLVIASSLHVICHNQSLFSRFALGPVISAVCSQSIVSLCRIIINCLCLIQCIAFYGWNPLQTTDRCEESAVRHCAISSSRPGTLRFEHRTHTLCIGARAVLWLFYVLSFNGIILCNPCVSPASLPINGNRILEPMSCYWTNCSCSCVVLT